MSNDHAGPTGYSWAYDTSAIDWDELSGLYRIASLGDKPPDALAPGNDDHGHGATDYRQR